MACLDKMFPSSLCCPLAFSLFQLACPASYSFASIGPLTSVYLLFSSVFKFLLYDPCSLIPSFCLSLSSKRGDQSFTALVVFFPWMNRNAVASWSGRIHPDAGTYFFFYLPLKLQDRKLFKQSYISTKEIWWSRRGLDEMVSDKKKERNYWVRVRSVWLLQSTYSADGWYVKVGNVVKIFCLDIYNMNSE